MAADTLQLKRGNTAAVAAYLPAVGEPVFDYTLKQLYVGDGVTVGGVRVGTLIGAVGVDFLDSPTAAAARSAITAAASGVNTDITSITGSAATLTTSRSIAATGDAAWSVNFDGSSNVSAAITLAPSGVAAGTYGSVTVNAKGLVTAASAITPIANGGTGLGAQAFTNFALQNSWVVIASRRAAYRKVIDMVQIEMQIVSGTATDGTLLGTLPVGFRPPNTLAVVVQSAPAVAPSSSVALPRVVIGSDGTITCQNCTSAGGIQFTTLISTV